MPPVSRQLPSSQGTSNLGWIDSLRAIAAIYVVLHHAALNIPHGAVPDRLSSLLKLIFGHGHFSVDVFIVLSGFCLTLPMLARQNFGSYWVYLARRTVRIVLPYYVVCALSLLLIALWIGQPTDTHWGVSLPVTRAGVITHLLLIHQWWPSTAAQINHPLWSVAVEYQIYLLFPAILWICRRQGSIGSTVFITLAAYALWTISDHLGYPNPNEWGVSINYVGLFSLGVAAALTSRYRRVARWEWWAAGFLVVFMSGWVVEQMLRAHDVEDELTGFFIGLAAACYLHIRLRGSAGVVSKSKAAAAGLIARFLRFWGERSFSLYLVHAPVLQLVWLYVIRPLHLERTGLMLSASLVLGLAASLMVTLGFHWFVEKPCHRWSQRIGHSKSQSAQVLLDNASVAPMALVRTDPR